MDVAEAASKAVAAVKNARLGRLWRMSDALCDLKEAKAPGLQNREIPASLWRGVI
jgi:hypothetical protein